MRNILKYTPQINRLNGTVKASKLEKNYPMCVPYGISKYLAKIIQHRLNKSQHKIKNSAEQSKSMEKIPN